MRHTLALLALAGTALPTLAAPCDNIFRYGVPDFDQRRANLDEDGGYHCVPTSAINWMAYMRNHGCAGAMGHSSSNWASNSEHGYVGGRILDMGDQMNTGGIGHSGTTTDGALDGLVDYFEDHNVEGFWIFCAYIMDDDWAPSPKSLRNHMAAGQLIMMIYGRYDLDGDQWERDGGHCVSLVKVNDPCGTNPLLGFSDPAGDEGADDPDRLYHQSPFKIKEWTMKKVTRNMDGDVLNIWEPVGQTGTTGRKILDKFITLWPMAGWTAPPTINGVIKFNFHFTNNDEAPEQQQFNLPNNATISSFAPSSRDPGFFATSNLIAGVSPAKLYFFDTAEETWLPLATETSNYLGLTTDRHGNPITLTGDQRAKKYRILGDGSVRPVSSIALRYPANAVTTDDKTDDIWILCRNDRKLLRYAGGDLAALPTVYALPTGVTLGGDSSMDFNPVDGKLWLTSVESSAAYQLTRSDLTGQLGLSRIAPLPNSTYPLKRSLRFTDKGLMTFISGGVVRELKDNPTNGLFEPNPRPLFGGKPASGFFAMDRSRTNFNPAKHSGRAWFDHPNPDPETPEITLCPADFNGDNQVDFFDYLDFVSAFDRGNMNADVNFDESLDFFDYLDFVGWYSQGC
jgi:hypothetical protein